MSSSTFQPEAGGPDSRHRLLVSVDFGTTYTGVAYCLSSSHSLEEIEAITTWPGNAGNVEKIPTEICYGQPGQAPHWGAEASSALFSRQGTNQSTIYGRFKLLLDPSIGRDVYGELAPARANFDAGDSSSKISLPPGKTAINVSTDYLKELYKHVMDNILAKRIPGTLENTPIEFIFTVPAIWSHKAQQATKAAAALAGFGYNISKGRVGDTLTMISEPEAAAVYAITAMHEEKKKRQSSGMFAREMGVNEHFVVCDAGGGTVDLITYQIHEVFPELKLIESVVGSGGKCGSTYIDEAFHRFLRNKIGPKFDNERVWTAKRKGRGSTLMQKFEVCKRTFGQAGDEKWYLELPVAVPDDEQHGIMDNELELRASDMKALFDPVVQDIITLVEAQVNKVKFDQNRNGELTTVILVGGFGESQYLYQRLQKWGDEQIPPLTIVNPPKSWSAIMRGAIAQSIRPAVQSRKLRSHYGFACSTAYDAKVHKQSDARLSVWGGWVVDDNVAWTGHIGDDCSTKKLIELPIFFDLQSTASMNHSVDLYGCRYKEAAREMTSHKVFKIGAVYLDFSSIKLNTLTKKTQNGVVHYKLDAIVKMLIGSADVNFSFWIGNKRYGQATINYDA